MSKKHIDYARSHDVVLISAKRYDQSPYRAKYATPDTVFGVYANRFYPLSLGDDPITDYWKVRQAAMLYDVPERPVSIQGPDAVAFVEKLFTRKIGRLKRWRARYAIACTPQGTILMDGVLIRLAHDHFWYVKANGEFDTWLLAFSHGLDVTIHDPQSWVLQVQGPRALDILHAATGQSVDHLGYFHAQMFDFGGTEHLVTRTGWTGELGFEVYSNPRTDHHALWDLLLAAGKPFGLGYGSLASMGLRRMEAGILDNGTDIDMTMTPFEAGLGEFVDFSKPDFIGKQALENAARGCKLFGLLCDTGVPSAGNAVLHAGQRVGRMTTGSWSPTLEKGIGYVRFDSAEKWLGQTVTLQDASGQHHPATVVALPFYDREKRLPRGLPEDAS